jgi:hypothetical protein
MKRLFHISFWILAIGLVASEGAHGFSLTGPKTPWQVARIGYPDGLLFGPMNLTDEYRWNVPTAYYSFTADFLSYFGQRGVDEVEKAISILNALPAASNVNLDDFPLSSLRVNHRAQALGLTDLKSASLSLLLHHMGLEDPTIYVYTMRKRWIGPGPAPTNYYTIKRSFDPVTWQHSSFINGQLFTYSIAEGQDVSASIPAAVDPLALAGLINLPVTSVAPNGGFWTGLTRDDIGGLRYIYRPSNYNVENVTNAFVAGFGAIATGGSGGSPWLPAGAGGGGGGAAPALGGTNFVGTALRPGIDKLNFVRVNFDSQFGFYRSNTVSWVDRYITNNRTFNQTLSRPQLLPDILFDAADLHRGGADALSAIVQISFLAWDNNNVINGDPNSEAGTDGNPNWGPGVIPPTSGNTPSAVFTFNSAGPTLYNVWPFSLNEVTSSLAPPLWGSFDGSTNAPFVYPFNTSIEEVERLVLGGASGGGGSGGGGGGAGFVSPWVPVLTPAPTTGTGTGAGGGTGGGGTGTVP